MQTQYDIMKRLKEAFHSDENVSTVEGSFTSDTLAANAVEFEKAYAELDLVLDAAFPQSSWGEYLTRKAEEHGIIRREATKSKVVVTVKGTSGATVPKGVIFSTASGYNFLTTESAIISTNGEVNVSAEADVPGAEHNVSAETITKIPVSIYGVSSVINHEAATDGYDIEDDKTLLERLLYKVRVPATSGNAAHYQLWAQAVPGVGAVKVMPLWNGNGTVKVVITDSNSDFAQDELIKRVKAYIEEQRPIGATVTVSYPEKLDITIRLRQLEGNATEEEIKAKINDYFRINLFRLQYVSVAQIGRLLLDETKVGDYTELSVNGGTSNIQIRDGQLPVVKAVIVT